MFKQPCTGQKNIQIIQGGEKKKKKEGKGKKELYLEKKKQNI